MPIDAPDWAELDGMPPGDAPEEAQETLAAAGLEVTHSSFMTSPRGPAVMTCTASGPPKGVNRSARRRILVLAVHQLTPAPPPGQLIRSETKRRTGSGPSRGGGF